MVQVATGGGRTGNQIRNWTTSTIREEVRRSVINRTSAYELLYRCA